MIPHRKLPTRKLQTLSSPL